jgi:hypothetical protein
MTHEIVITTPDEAGSVTADPNVPGRYRVTKTTTVTETVTTQTWIDVQVIDHPDNTRTVIFGWNAANGTVDGLQEMIDTYGMPDVCRIFTGPGKGIISWNSPLLALLDPEVVLIYSWKDWPLPAGAFSNWMTSKPTDRFPEVWWCIDHEPEQGPESGDPDPVLYRQQWTQALAIYNNHPRKAQFYPVPIFTEFYARKYDTVPNPATGGTWWDDFGVVAEFHGMRGIGFDIYDTGYAQFTLYRTPEHRNEIPLKYAMRVRLPLLICEWNIAEKSNDPDGIHAAQAIRDNVTYLRNEVNHPVPYVTWFHTGGGVLFDRPASQEAYMDAMDENSA